MDGSCNGRRPRGGGIGALAALDGGIVHYRAVVLVGGRGFTCAAAPFREAALENRALFEATLRFERQISAQCAQLAICNVAHPLAARLARWLARVYDLSGETKLVFTQEMMAEWLGARRTSVTLAATHLNRLGAISYSRGGDVPRRTSWAFSELCQWRGIATVPTRGTWERPMDPNHRAVMSPHSRAMLQRMLPEAESQVALGAERVQVQEARVAALGHNGALADQSKKLLDIMKQTQKLQIQHVMLLRRELAESK
jgi:Crp-like helix-turn-helix domain